MSTGDFFKGYVDKKVLCKSGEVLIPLRTSNLTSMLATFSVKTSKLESRIPSRLKPLSVLGRSVLIIGGMEYREMNIGPYNEIVVLVPVRFPGKLPPQARTGFVRERIGVYVMLISVTTQVALDAGIDIWGYPKSLSRIEFHDSGDRRTCHWTSEDKEVLSLSVRKSGIPIPFRRELIDFSVRGEELMKNALKAKFTVWVSPGNQVQASCGPHPVGQTLAGLIGPGRALMGGFAENGLGALDLPEWSVPL